jgi:RNA polymerase sigma-70 factor (ECF subfamily)
MLIVMRHLQGMRYDAIAAATGLPLGTVKTGIHRARRRLRAALAEEGIESGP